MFPFSHQLNSFFFVMTCENAVMEVIVLFGSKDYYFAQILNLKSFMHVVSWSYGKARLA